jgi:hypothetical protein
LVRQGVVKSGVNSQELVITLFEEASTAALRILPDLVKKQLPDLLENKDRPVFFADVGGGTTDLAELSFSTFSGVLGGQRDSDGGPSTTDDGQDCEPYLNDWRTVRATGSKLGTDRVAQMVLQSKQTEICALEPADYLAAKDWFTSAEITQILSQITSFDSSDDDQYRYGGVHHWAVTLDVRMSDFRQAFKTFVNIAKKDINKMTSRALARNTTGMKPVRDTIPKNTEQSSRS